MSRNYNRDEVIRKLIKKRIKPVPPVGNLQHLETSERTFIGNKLWGMIDFLGVPVVRIKGRVKIGRRR